MLESSVQRRFRPGPLLEHRRLAAAAAAAAVELAPFRRLCGTYVTGGGDGDGKDGALLILLTAAGIAGLTTPSAPSDSTIGLGAALTRSTELRESL